MTKLKSRRLEKKMTQQEVSKRIGISLRSYIMYENDESREGTPKYGLNYQKLGKKLMSQDELAVMDGGKCIFQLRGVRPFFSEKYDITKHPRYKYLADANKRNSINIE